MSLLDIESFARGEMESHLSYDWKFVWSDTKSTIGTCFFKKKEIHLSYRWAEVLPFGEIRDTILHEIAHVIAGPAAKHGPEWKMVARRLGCRPQATAKFSADILAKVRGKTIEDSIKYVMVDPDGKIVKRYMRKPNPSTYRDLSILYCASRKKETFGKLKIVSYVEYKRAA